VMLIVLESYEVRENPNFAPRTPSLIAVSNDSLQGSMS